MQDILAEDSEETAQSSHPFEEITRYYRSPRKHCLGLCAYSSLRYTRRAPLPLKARFTLEQPRTTFSFSLLNLFQLLTNHGKLLIYDFHKCMTILTDASGIVLTPVMLFYFDIW